jgi:hypothetical protein
MPRGSTNSCSSKNTHRSLDKVRQQFQEDLGVHLAAEAALAGIVIVGVSVDERQLIEQRCRQRLDQLVILRVTLREGHQQGSAGNLAAFGLLELAFRSASRKRFYKGLGGRGNRICGQAPAIFIGAATAWSSSSLVAFSSNWVQWTAPSSVPRPSLRLHRQQGDALYAEFLASATRVVRNELVGWIVLNLDYLHAGRCDLGAIVVLLSGSANAGGP